MSARHLTADHVWHQPGQMPRSVSRQAEYQGGRVEYRAELEAFPVSCTQGEQELHAEIVATSYVAGRVAGIEVQPAARPVIFFFNGGPISPSLYVHMLAFGPQRFRIAEDLQADPAGFRTEDNPDTLLDVADLVFYDPPGTGFSRVAEGTAADAFFSVESDAQVFEVFVRSWCTLHGRMDSPKYVFGESYGTLRAAVASRMMVTGDSPVGLQGVYLFGQALNIVETVNRPENVISYVVSLPTLAALGAYHGCTRHAGRPLHGFMEEVLAYAGSSYLTALCKGRDIGREELHAVAARLEDYTGLGADVFIEHRLRVGKNDYRRLLLQPRKLLLGGQDGRYVGDATTQGDPSGRFYPALIAAHRDYLDELFGLPAELSYVTESPITSLEGWKWGGTTPFSDWRYGACIAEAMQVNPGLQLMLGVGYHDTFTTYGAARYAIRHSDWPLSRVSLKAYEGGHMAYTRQESFLAMGEDLRRWITTMGKDRAQDKEQDA